jgi:arsenite methyltransferase
VSEVILYGEDAAKRIQALSGTPQMRAQRRFVLEALAPERGESILDVGCGPGHLTAELARAVGPDGRACGVDISADMLALAKDRDIELIRADGPTLPLPDESFDAAVATQVYEFVEQLAPALAELHRVVRGGGRALVLDTDWDTLVWHSRDRARMGRVLDGWRRCVADPLLPRTLATRLRDAGFDVTGQDAFVIFDPIGDERSYSAHQIRHLGASAVGVDRTEVAAWAADLEEMAAAGEYFFSLNRYVFLVRKPPPLSRAGAPSGRGLEVGHGEPRGRAAQPRLGDELCERRGRDPLEPREDRRIAVEMRSGEVDAPIVGEQRLLREQVLD